MTRAAAIVGLSGSGKTTLIESLIRLYVGRGLRVAAIKHTHHPLNDRNEGDTARFLQAGASPVILAGEGEAVIFPDSGRMRYEMPRDLLTVACRPGFSPAGLDAGLKPGLHLVEGFKHFDGWPRIEVVRGQWREAAEVAAALDRIWGWP